MDAHAQIGERLPASGPARNRGAECARPPPGLYFHVPFCLRKCNYCDFSSVALRDMRDRVRLYLEAVARELAHLPEDFVPATIYLGGGTPTALSETHLDELLSLIHRRHLHRGATEWTCEANPGTLTLAKARQLRNAGVNRISLGVQSFDDGLLDFLGRVHSAADADSAVGLLREAGFENFSLDLMYAIPGQSGAQFERDLVRALALAPDHLSLYALTLEEGTPLKERADAGEFAPVGDEAALEHYELARRRLREAGYVHYEISNFARPGRECRHNLLYWSGGEYLGVGPSAHSHWRGVRWGNLQGLEEYVAALSQAGKLREFEEQLAPEAHARETLVFSLRQLAGVRREDFLARTGYDYEELCGAALGGLIEEGLLEPTADGEGLRLSERALFISNTVFAELI